MIEHVWTVLCRSSVVDNETKRMSLLDVVEEIHISERPQPKGVVRGPFQIVSLWARRNFSKPGKGNARVSLIGPTDAQISQTQYGVDLSSPDSHRYRYRLYLDAFPARETGRYTFRVELRQEESNTWELVAAVPVELDFALQKEGGKGR